MTKEALRVKQALERVDLESPRTEPVDLIDTMEALLSMHSVGQLEDSLAEAVERLEENGERVVR